MSRNRSVYGLLGFAFVIAWTSTRPVAADPPLRQLPPPEKATPPDKPLPVLPPPEKPAPAVPVTLVPVEFRVTIPDLEKQILRAIAQKVDPKAEPVLPFVVKGNEKEFALRADAGPPEAPKPIEGAKDAPAMQKPQLIPRQPGAFPRLDRLAERPLVAGLVGRILATIDLNYRIEVRSIKVTATGKTITCEVGAGYHGEAKGIPGGPPPPPDVRDLSIKISITKDLEWSEAGKLQLKEGTTKVWIDPEAPLVGFPRLNVERVIQLNGVLSSLDAILDRELMKRVSPENLPDLAVIAPNLKQKMPLLAVSELHAYPIRGDENNVYFTFDVGLIPARKQTADPIKVGSKPGPAPEPKLRGRIVFDKDGKPEVKIEQAK